MQVGRDHSSKTTKTKKLKQPDAHDTSTIIAITPPKHNQQQNPFINVIARI